MRLVTPAVAAGQTNSVSSSQAAEEHENLYVFFRVQYEAILITNQEHKLCVLVSGLSLLRMSAFSCSSKGWFYAVSRSSGSTCCIRTLHTWTNSVLSCKKNYKVFFVTIDVLPHFSWRLSNVEVFGVLGFWCLTCCAGTSECSESCTLRLFGVRFC